MLGAGCSTLPPPLPGRPEGDAAARRQVRRLAVVGFLVRYDFGPDMDLFTVFSPGTRYQLVPESMFACFADELGTSPCFELVLPVKVKEDSFYRSMKIEPDPRSRLRSTCPAGYRKLRPTDEYDYRGLCRSLAADGLILFEFSYSTFSSMFTRSARIHAADLLALSSDGTVLYQRDDFGQTSGSQYFAEYAWLRRKTMAQDIHCLEVALRSVARDFVLAFAPR